MTELSWPIESVSVAADGYARIKFAVPFHGDLRDLYATTEQLAAAGIPAEPYPTPPVTITVTVGDRSEVVELTELQQRHAVALFPDGYATAANQITARIGAALRRLGVQP